MTKLSLRQRAPPASSQNVRSVMKANVGGESAIEKRFRRYLYRAGLRYRAHFCPVPNVRLSADIVFVRSRICVFIDGCFWHGCETHFGCPKANAAWWREKILSNKIKDHRASQLLSASGWKVVRFWEHEIRNNLDRCVREVVELNKSLLQSLESERPGAKLQLEGI